MPERKAYTGELHYILKGIGRWFSAALVILAVVSLILSLSSLSASGFGYVSSAISFAAAITAGAAAANMKGRGGLVTGFISGIVLTVLLLTVGFIIAGDKLSPDGVLSVAAFTLSGCILGAVVFYREKRTGGKRKKRKLLTARKT